MKAKLKSKKTNLKAKPKNKIIAKTKIAKVKKIIKNKTKNIKKIIKSSAKKTKLLVAKIIKPKSAIARPAVKGKITEESTLEQVLKLKNIETVFSEFQVPCISCPMAEREMATLTLKSICRMYGIDLKGLLVELNKL
ncbi:MAG: hypothetical protein V1824_00780 [archaeon]